MTDDTGKAPIGLQLFSMRGEVQKDLAAGKLPADPLLDGLTILLAGGTLLVFSTAAIAVTALLEHFVTFPSLSCTMAIHWTGISQYEFRSRSANRISRRCVEK